MEVSNSRDILLGFANGMAVKTIHEIRPTRLIESLVLKNKDES